ncbi:hypothetical protein [Pallidibacillus thermolactis]|nr:hypothetical protein [Pallidibacillus thermolactis subsp. kokeshiiformis]
MSNKFLTPEEMADKRARNKRLFYISVPIIGGIIGIVTALFPYIM